MTRRKKALGILAGTAAIGFAGAMYAANRRRFSGIKLKRSIIIDRSPAELYAFWRNLRDVAELVDIVDSVQVQDEKRSHWVIRGPAGFPVAWDAEITTDRTNEMIGWRSTEDSTIETAGYVRFEQAPGSRGTLVRIALEYYPPAGRVGAAVSSVFGKRPEAFVEQLLRKLKQRMEAGEIARA